MGTSTPDAEAHAGFALLRLLVRHMVHHSVIKREELASDLALLCDREATVDDDLHARAAELLRQVLDELG